MRIILTLFLFISITCCGQTHLLKVSVDDYIQTYKNSKADEELIAISVSIKDSKYFISDISKTMVYGYANKLTSNKNLFIGTYQGIFCVVYDKIESNEELDFIKPINLFFLQESNEASKTIIDGKTIIFDLALTTHEPNLAIEYDYSSKTKLKYYLDGKTEKVKM